MIVYYPYGGFGDFKAAFHTKDEAKFWVDKQIEKGEWRWDNYQIINICDTFLFDENV